MARQWQQVSLEQARQHPLYGVKNWLAVFAFGVLLIPLREYGALNGVAYDAGLSLAQLLATDQRYGRFVMGMLVLDIFLAAVILWSIYTKDRSFRVTATWLLLSYWPSAALIAAVTRAFEVPGVAGGLTSQFVASSWVLAAWVAYLHRSHRVRVTFENSVVATEMSPSKTQEGFMGKDASGSPPARVSMKGVRAADVQLDSGPSEEFWSRAGAELESTSRRPGLWARVFSEAQGNESLAKANYLRYRALELHQQHDAQSEKGRRNFEEAARVDTIPEPTGRIATVPDAVPQWVSRFVPVTAGVAVFGIVAAVALPAYQDYTRRQPATANAAISKVEPAGASDSADRPPAPATAMRESPAVESHAAYVAKVRSIQASVRQGRVAAIKEVNLLYEPPQAGKALSDAEAARLEAGQTWWRDGSVFYVHITNTGAGSISGIGFQYSEDPCDVNGQAQTYYLTLWQPIARGSEAVIEFSSPVLAGNSPSSCLRITGVWGV